VTSDLEKRVWEHKNKAVRGFTARYNVDRLLYYEFYPKITAAIAREKQLKGWLRQRKLDLIATMNPNFADLAPDLFDWAKAGR
jgi:putative endonuclease